MKLEKNSDALQPQDTSATNPKTEQEIAALPEPESAQEKLSESPRVVPSETGEAAGGLEVSAEAAKASASIDIDGSEAAGLGELRPELDEMPSPSMDREPE